MMDLYCGFDAFDEDIEIVKNNDEELYNHIKRIENDLKELVDSIQDEIQRMWDDWQDDHDNYDSLERERQIRNMKYRVNYLKTTINDMLEKAGYDENIFLF